MVFARVAVMAAAFQLLFSFHAAAETLTDGDSLDPNSRMGKYLYSEAMLTHIREMTIQTDKRSGFACEGTYNLSQLSLTVHQPIELPENAAHPISGAWVYKYDALRCGKTQQFELLLAAAPNDERRALMLPPGNTLASLPVILGVMKSAEESKATVFGPDCAGYAFTNTKVGRPPLGPGSDWLEFWTAKGCGKEVNFLVIFTPGEGGTTVKLKAKLR